WRPGNAAAAFPGLTAARDAGLEAAAIFPFLPGWTAEPAVVDSLAAAAKEGGAASFSAIPPTLDGEGRRAAVEARTSVDPSAGDSFFELVHHGSGGDRLIEEAASARAAAQRRGLRPHPPRPLGRGERPGNSLAASRLEELAEEHEAEEPRAALLYAAVRWIDGAARDLASIAREGNFRKVFPFLGEPADAAEEVLRGAP